ncbi:hypothetical protein BV25DRAFT_1830012 [Artomyces pyxidatus]|uniref:Uncharacterized protein n=1 Tax=Artomyces pyxidatus TaxID=48021 RepID=A0ACB8SPY9_9AGAM|nr:hypothetical protein BV25DRAFT_1830012 [Artomyces pyxidatus]
MSKKPMLILPPELDYGTTSTRDSQRDALLHFGVAVPTKKIFRYALKHGLVDPATEMPKDFVYMMSILRKVKQDLQTSTKTPSLYTKYPVAHQWDPSEPIVFVLYSDNNQARMKEKLRDEKATAEAIRAIFEIEEPVMWHWDYTQCLDSLQTCPPIGGRGDPNKRIIVICRAGLAVCPAHEDQTKAGS